MVKKFFVILLVITIALTIGSYFNKVYGTGIDAMSEIRNLTNQDAQEDSKLIAATQSLSGTFITIFKVVGVGVAVIMLIVLAMKYMIAAPGDKADIKKHAIIYIVGAVCLFGAVGIVSILQNLFSQNFTE